MRSYVATAREWGIEREKERERERERGRERERERGQREEPQADTGSSNKTTNSYY